jgi:hypothetical protein
MKAVHTLEGKMEATVAQALAAGWKKDEVPIVDAEDCFASEDGTEEGMQRAVVVWSNILSSLGVADVNTGEVRGHLQYELGKSGKSSCKTGVGCAKGASKLEDAIANAAEVRAVLSEEGAPYSGWLDGHSLASLV